MTGAPASAGLAVAPYDAIAEQYRRTKEAPLRRYVERYSLFGMLGDLSDLAVLDLACGDGCYSREIRRRGARRVVGVDVSSRMIDLARNGQADGDVEYRVCDAAELPAIGPFDLVCASYLLHYARDVAELSRMCHSIARQLPAGGRFVALNENPDQPEEHYEGYLRYGFSKSVARPRHEGAPISYAMVSGRELIRFEAYHYERATYERALHQAGFTQIEWQPLQLDPAGLAVMGESYWAEYLGNPPVIGLTCVRD